MWKDESAAQRAADREAGAGGAGAVTDLSGASSWACAGAASARLRSVNAEAPRARTLAERFSANLGASRRLRVESWAFTLIGERYYRALA